MAATGVATPTQPDYATQSATAYPGAIDDLTYVMARLAAAFAVYEKTPAVMNVNISAGSVFSGQTLTAVAAQSSGVIVAPTVNPRLDVVYVDAFTGVVGVATGSEAASPVDPTIPLGKIPVARLWMTVGMTAIGNGNMDDIRPAIRNFADTQGASVASANSSIGIWATDGTSRHITGSTGPITGFGTAPRAGSWMRIVFDSTPTITNGANCILPGGADYVATAGDFAWVYANTTTQFYVWPFRADGSAINKRLATAVASAATCNIWGGTGDFIHITGSTGPITSLGTAPRAGAEMTVIFDSTPTLTHNATSLILPGGTNIVAAAGDRMVVRAESTSNMRVVTYIPAAVKPPFNDLVVLQDSRANNTAATAFGSTGAWATTVLNTEAVDTGGICSLSSNQFTLQPGSYEISGTLLLGNSTNQTKVRLRLQNITDGSTVCQGPNSLPAASVDQVVASIFGAFTITAAKTFEIQAWIGVSTISAAQPLNNSSVEVYSNYLIRRYAAN